MASLTDLNRAHFDNEASRYDAKHEQATEEIAQRIKGKLDFLGVDWVEDGSSEEEDEDGKGDGKPERQVRLLDYACGTGSMSRIFAPYTTQCIGIDLSEKMVQIYNARALNQGLAEQEMMGYQGDLCVPTDEDPAAFRNPKFFEFEMACVGLGFHHFDDPSLAAKRLVSRLKSGGVLMILDFLPHGVHPDADGHYDHDHGHSHDHSHGRTDEENEAQEKALKTVTHHGFSEERIKEIFVEAGAGKKFAIEKLGSVTMGMRHGKRHLFMARGTKA
ncbi:hypothetical protein N0V93_009079 [Gnomoniopsis smithogilvyi]|uniref:S-adenosyl-L-methionine-dependent methyltransferase n=1 Tax=Gnomoniopsis smithogilvyi TaxID=1191159 RepID=A0A9W9CSG5_9PEZI|nr:hypothetical protein N0V93_009079 [Gnomoniopsis smithogilvyi]